MFARYGFLSRDFQICNSNFPALSFFSRGSLSDSEYGHLVGNLSELIETHAQMNQAIAETLNESPRDQRVGKVLLLHGANIKSAHLKYWANHPRAVCVLEKHRDKLDKIMEGMFGFFNIIISGKSSCRKNCIDYQNKTLNED